MLEIIPTAIHDAEPSITNLKVASFLQNKSRLNFTFKILYATAIAKISPRMHGR